MDSLLSLSIYLSCFFFLFVFQRQRRSKNGAWETKLSNQAGRFRWVGCFIPGITWIVMLYYRTDTINISAPAAAAVLAIAGDPSSFQTADQILWKKAKKGKEEALETSEDLTCYYSSWSNLRRRQVSKTCCGMLLRFLMFLPFSSLIPLMLVGCYSCVCACVYSQLWSVGSNQFIW